MIYENENFLVYCMIGTLCDIIECDIIECDIIVSAWHIVEIKNESVYCNGESEFGGKPIFRRVYKVFCLDSMAYIYLLSLT